MKINKVVYNGDTLLDLTSDTVTPQTMLSGATAHAANGQSISGTVDLNGKADKVANSTAGHFAGLDSSGNLTDSGKSASDFDNVWLGTRAEHTAAETAGTLPETAIIGITDESSSGGNIIDDEHVSTETTYSSEKIESLFELPLKTFGGCTDEEFVDIIEKADAGELNPSNYWAVGDERAISIAAMPEINQDDVAHDAQTRIFVITHVGLYRDENDKIVNFIVSMKGCLWNPGRMNNTATSENGWNGCERRTWCNTTFYNALPTYIKRVMKKFKTVSLNTWHGNTLITSLDYVAFPALKEVSGSQPSYSGELEDNALVQFDYYKISANTLKGRGENSAVQNLWGRYWTRTIGDNTSSPDSFIVIFAWSSSANRNAQLANSYINPSESGNHIMISPFICI